MSLSTNRMALRKEGRRKSNVMMMTALTATMTPGKESRFR